MKTGPDLTLLLPLHTVVEFVKKRSIYGQSICDVHEVHIGNLKSGVRDPKENGNYRRSWGSSRYSLSRRKENRDFSLSYCVRIFEKLMPPDSRRAGHRDPRPE